MDNVFLKSKASGVYKILWTLLKEEKVLNKVFKIKFSIINMNL